MLLISALIKVRVYHYDIPRVIITGEIQDHVQRKVDEEYIDGGPDTKTRRRAWSVRMRQRPSVRCSTIYSRPADASGPPSSRPATNPGNAYTSTTLTVVEATLNSAYRELLALGSSL